MTLSSSVNKAKALGIFRRDCASPDKAKVYSGDKHSWVVLARLWKGKCVLTGSVEFDLYPRKKYQD